MFSSVVCRDIGNLFFLSRMGKINKYDLKNSKEDL